MFWKTVLWINIVLFAIQLSSLMTGLSLGATGYSTIDDWFVQRLMLEIFEVFVVLGTVVANYGYAYRVKIYSAQFWKVFFFIVIAEVLLIHIRELLGRQIDATIFVLLGWFILIGWIVYLYAFRSKELWEA